MAYKNPIPCVDMRNEYKINTKFKFEDFVSPEEAAKGIENLINENGGIPLSWLGGEGEISQSEQNKQTNFEKITSSPEILAEYTLFMMRCGNKEGTKESLIDYYNSFEID